MTRSYRQKMKPWKLEKAKQMRKKPTAAEKALWAELRCEALGVKFRRQAPMVGYIADFYCPSKGLVIEADGSSHTDCDYDKRRDRHLMIAGKRTLRFTNEEILNDMPMVLKTIRKCL